ncbi:MAG: tryptophan/tyrosine permease [Gammaproteobacteria bacterium]|nr:tryptophan/tyrosine permease [Gammaproteobacteria bacterium]
MDFKLIGSILLIVGTSLGAGMLALPIVTAQLGFLGAVALLVGCWFLLTAGAFLILEVNLWFSHHSNMITMAKKTIGPLGQIIAWVTYLLLLYSLLCAYIAGGTDLLSHLTHAAEFNIPFIVSAVLFTTFFGAIVWQGIRIVDYSNRLLMMIKFTAYFALVALLLPFISIAPLMKFELTSVTSSAAIMVTITSFGYAAIVPSLRVYFADDIQKLKIAILIGSLIPLVCYFFWDMVIMGVIPLGGSQGLNSILSSTNPNSALVNALISSTSQAPITFFIKLFASICVVTSFLGVSLCLGDFLADGLGVEKKGWPKVFVYLLTFAPPLLIVAVFPNAFLKALEYAGIYCVILLVFLPALMAYRGRYLKHYPQSFRVPGGKIGLLALMAISILLIIFAALT